jgi:hypothetical protein
MVEGREGEKDLTSLLIKALTSFMRTLCYDDPITSPPPEASYPATISLGIRSSA